MKEEQNVQQAEEPPKEVPDEQPDGRVLGSGGATLQSRSGQYVDYTNYGKRRYYIYNYYIVILKLLFYKVKHLKE